ncbi:MAG: hypothetical protein IBJ18_13455 [Phycisphaerales bacterium]|nr:hypothetical protein [Phycisphaerales bacterium]
MPETPLTHESPELIAFRTGNTRGWNLLPAPVSRPWINETMANAAGRCLPLTVANQAGWWITSPRTFIAVWDGGAHPRSLKLLFADDHPASTSSKDDQIASVFGAGIVTFIIPWLFRTPSNLQLLARGPTNLWKDGAAPLDGLIETDWSPYSFTMNWRLTRPGLHVRFEAGEPICQILPIRIGDAESLRPRFAQLREEPGLENAHALWQRNRAEQYTQTVASGEQAFRLDYTKGLMPDGQPARCPHHHAPASPQTPPTHRTRLNLQPFNENAGHTPDIGHAPA